MTLISLETLKKLPIAEFVTFFVLLLITLFRRRLSSNDEYRKNKPRKETKKLNRISSLTRNSAGYSLCLTSLSTDVLVHLLGYLTTSEIIQIMQVSRPLLKEIRSDLIWEQLWIQTYSRVWQHPQIRRLREGRGIYWDPCLNFGPPQQGWFQFYIMFEVAWLDWILAGYCTTACCVVAIRNVVLDVTEFIHEHPGSQETLTEGAGCDATESFEEIGHSTNAESLMKRFVVWDCNRSVLRKKQSNKYTHSSDVQDSDTEVTVVDTVDKEVLSPSRYKNRIETQRRIVLQHTQLQSQMKINKRIICNLASEKNSSGSLLQKLPSRAEAYQALLYQTNQIKSSAAAAAATAAASAAATAAAVSSAVATSSSSVVSGVMAVAPALNIPSLIGGNSSSDGGDGASKRSDSGEYIDIGDVDFTDVFSGVTRSYLHSSDNSTPTFQLEEGSDAAAAASALGAGEEQQQHPPLGAYFNRAHRVVPKLDGYFDCAGQLLAELHNQQINNEDLQDREYKEHFGQPKVCFDPLTQEWVVWWTCCGKGEVLVEAPSEDTEGKGSGGKSGESSTLKGYYDTVNSKINEHLKFFSLKTMYNNVKVIVRKQSISAKSEEE